MVAPTGPAPSSRTARDGARALTPAERGVLVRLVTAVPSASAALLAGLDDARVLDATGWVGQCPARSVVLEQHWGRPSAWTLPVRGFAVDGTGRTVGEVVVWVADDALVGFRVCSAPGHPLPASLDPDALAVVPWPAGRPGAHGG